MSQVPWLYLLMNPQHLVYKTVVAHGGLCCLWIIINSLVGVFFYIVSFLPTGIVELTNFEDIKTLLENGETFRGIAAGFLAYSVPVAARKRFRDDQVNGSEQLSEFSLSGLDSLGEGTLQSVQKQGLWKLLKQALTSMLEYEVELLSAIHDRQHGITQSCACELAQYGSKRVLDFLLHFESTLDSPKDKATWSQITADPSNAHHLRTDPGAACLHMLSLRGFDTLLSQLTSHAIQKARSHSQETEQREFRTASTLRKNRVRSGSTERTVCVLNFSEDGKGCFLKGGHDVGPGEIRFLLTRDSYIRLRRVHGEALLRGRKLIPGAGFEVVEGNKRPVMRAHLAARKHGSARKV